MSKMKIDEASELVADLVTDVWARLGDMPKIVSSDKFGLGIRASELNEVEPIGGTDKWDEAVGILAPDRMIFTDAKPSDVWPINITCAKHLWDDGICLVHARSVSIRELRGQKILGSRAIESITAWISRAGNVVGSNKRYVFWNGRRWLCPDVDLAGREQAFKLGITPNTARFSEQTSGGAQEVLNTQIAMGVAFTRDYDWRIIIDTENGSSMSLATTPRGVLRFWRDREIADGKSRRAALKHWVQAHFRRPRDTEEDDEATILVREHLRGSVNFGWCGLRCSIEVSPHDLRKNEALAELRRAKSKRTREFA